MPANFSLEVPHIPQVDDGYCLPACAEMVPACYGIRRSQHSLATVLDVSPGFGVPASRVSRLVSRQLTAIRRQGDLGDLVDALAKGIPPIIEVATRQLAYWQREDSQHVLVLTGLRELDGRSFATVNDPAFDAPIALPMDELMLAWIERDTYFIEMQPV